MKKLHSAQMVPSRNGDEITAVNSAGETSRLRKLCKSLMEEAPMERPEFRKLLETLERRGLARIGAIKALSSFSGTYCEEELWDGAKALVSIIKDKTENAGERFAAVDAIVAVMNSISSARGGGNGMEIDARAEGLLQNALPMPGIGSSSDALEDGVKAHKEKVGRMEGVREDSLIVLLNSISVAEIFDNRELSMKIKEAIMGMDSPYAKKLSGSWRDSSPPAENCAIEEETDGFEGRNKKRISLGELFGTEEEEDLFEVG